ncbi:RHS repeat domain-containing protein, partial [Aliikangiella maris]
AQLTDEQGNIIWQATFKPYGEIEQIEAKDNTICNLRFQGQYFDAETQLHYNRFRYYDARNGRFTSQDPIGLLGGINNYQYAPNPLSWVDPLGLVCKESEQKLSSALNSILPEKSAELMAEFKQLNNITDANPTGQLNSQDEILNALTGTIKFSR